jgi:hypothetical protein
MNDRIAQVTSAWETLRSNKSFAGMNLDQFRGTVAPSLSARQTIAHLENEAIAAQNQRDEADRKSMAAILLVVNAIKGDPQEGEDGELYEAMGYVRKSERKSGLSRKSTAKATASAK